MMRRLTSCCGIAAAMLASAISLTTAAAQSWPTKPITIIVGYPAGGSNDIVTRVVAPGLSEKLGQQIIVENRSGAAGSIGAVFAARAQPDGYTLYMMSSAQALAPGIRKDLGYDPVKSYDPIALAVSSTYVLLASPETKVNSVKELIDLAKSKPGALKYASSGVGAGIHLTSERFKSVAGVDILHVPYRGDTPMLNDLLGSHVNMAFVPIPGAVPFVTAGTLRGLAVTSEKRIRALPSVPTIAESGGPAGINMSAWWGLVAPAGTPMPIRQKLETAMQEVLASAEVQKRFDELAFDTGNLTGEAYRKFIAEETAKFADIIAKSGVKVEQ